MAQRWSRLTIALIPVLEKIAALPLTVESRDLLETIVLDHGLDGDDPPSWMMELLSEIDERRPSEPGHWVPNGYPRGENGFTNLLADVEKEMFPLGIDDYGEGVTWSIPSCGVRVVIIRESSAPGPWVIVERLQV